MPIWLPAAIEKTVWMVSLMILTADAGSLPSVTPLEGPAEVGHPRPAWLEGGIVMAGAWSSLAQREHRIGASWVRNGYGLSETEAREAYRREQSPEMADRLRELGVTLVLIPLYSGHGTYAMERPGMEDSARFARLIHERGMRVGVYIHEGMLSRAFLDDRPESYDWLAWPSPDATWPPPPPETESEGRPVYRNHPEYQRFMRSLIDVAIDEVQADLLHFDNYVYTTGWSPQAAEDFRAYLRRKCTTAELDAHFGGADLTGVVRQAYHDEAPAILEWQQFQAWSFGDSFRKLAEYARSRNPEVATEVNAGGFDLGYRQPLDLSMLVPWGDCFWDEGTAFQWDAEKRLLSTGIRTYKLARLYRLHAFTYANRGSRLATCESMAFNYDSMGCLYWFLYGRLNWPVTANQPADDSLMPETRFYRENRDLFRGGETLADVAVFRARSVNVPGQDVRAPYAMTRDYVWRDGQWVHQAWPEGMDDTDPISNVYLFEQALITQHLPFEILFDQHLNNLSRYRAVALPDVRPLSETQIDRLLTYAENGGGLILTDQAATTDPWGRPRPDGLARFFPEPPREGITVRNRGKGRLVYVRIARPERVVNGSLPENDAELAAAVRAALGSPPSLSTDAPPSLGMEFVRRPHQIQINFFDYANGETTEPFSLTLAPSLGQATRARLLSPRQAPLDLEVSAGATGYQVAIPPFTLYAVVTVDLAVTP